MNNLANEFTRNLMNNLENEITRNLMAKKIQNVYKKYRVRQSLKMSVINPGRILWHARIQSLGSPRKNVMKSPNYLFTSPQISQALLHGLSIHENRNVYGDSVVELTKLRVKKPLRLINFKYSTNQKSFANRIMNFPKFKTFGSHDIRLLKFICTKMSDRVDGYRAIWDQDQVSLCARAIQQGKLEVVIQHDFNPTEFKQIKNAQNNITFSKPSNRNIPRKYYFTGKKTEGRQLVKVVKSVNKNIAIEAKQKRTRMYAAQSAAKRAANFAKALGIKPTSATTFNRPTTSVRRRLLPR